MKAHSIKLVQFIAAALFALPAIVCAAPPTTSPYYTDTVNSYVQDQVSQDMEELNGFLCLINAMAPDQLVNQGDYIAMVNPKACRPNVQQSSVNQGSNAATSYIAVQLNSTRESNTKPMLTKIWLDDFVDNSTTTAGGGAGGAGTGTTLSVPMYSSASQAPSKTLPYGVFRLDYCKQATSGPTATDPCSKRIGYIDASKTGLAFYTLDYKTGAYGEYLDEFALQLSANSSTNSGSGIVIKTNTNNATGAVNTSAIVFAHSPDYFFRDGGNNPQCFNRAEKYAEESVWRYGLYDATTGERLTHESGFPVEYVDASVTPSVTYNGYIGYWGLWMPVPVATGSTLTKITYDTYPPTKKDYTLLQAGGKLTKYTTNFKALSELHKLPFWYYPYANVAATGGGTAMTQYVYYEIYWDNTTTPKQFYVYSQYNSTTGNMEKLPTPIAVDSASLVAADTYHLGLSGYADAIGGSFNIKYTDFVNLVTTTSTTRVITQNQDVVYPKDFAALNTAGGLKCISDCPTVASISAYNADLALTTPTYLVYSVAFPSYSNTTYLPITYAALNNVGYTLDPVSGNLLEASGINAGKPVVQTNNYGVYSGRMVTGNDLTYIQSQKPSCAPAATCYSASDVDLMANNTTISSYSYYIWETSSNSYNQMGFLIDKSTTPATTVKFYAPLPVSFNVPNTTKYGNAAGSIISLQYSDFGNLWGIPYKCVDLRNNGDCVYSAVLTAAPASCTVPGGTVYPYTTYDPACSTTITPWDKQYWTAQYSIPFSTTDGVATAEISQGDPAEPATYIAKGTQYLVKALDKELRLARVPIGICTVLGLDQPISVTKLPSTDQWVDPTPTIGTKPVLSPVPAPRVIHGVVQY